MPEHQVDPLVAPLITAYLADAEQYAVTVARNDQLRVVTFEVLLTVSTTESDQRFFGLCQRKSAREVFRYPATTHAAAFAAPQEREVDWMEIHLHTELADRLHRDPSDPLATAVVYHELTHCLLGKGHGKEGIMAADFKPNAFTEAELTQAKAELFRPEYLAELPAF